MEALWITLAVIGTLIIVFILWYVSTSNTFSRMIVKIDESESSIDIALTKRYDLLTKMVAATKGYAKHEQETLIKVVETRQPDKSASIADKQTFANHVTEGLSKLSVVVEQYPDLKASSNFAKLQDASMEVEENLQAARRLYNSNVSIYNQKVVVFPSSLVASWKKLSKREFFEAESFKRNDVDFNF